MYKRAICTSIFALSFAACEGGDDVDLGSAESDREAIMRPPDAAELDALPISDAPDLPIIASITTHTGSTMEFVDEGEGFVGIAEFGGEPVVFKFVEEMNATPLEIFLAYSDAEEIPPALQASHDKLVEKQERDTDEPQVLEIPRIHPGYSEGYLYCGLDDAYDHLFQWEFEGWGYPTSVVAAVDQPFSNCSAGGYLWDLSSTCRFYPGAALNSATYLGVCNGPRYTGYDANKYEFRASRLIGGSWNAVYTRQMYASGTINGSRFVYYTSNSSYRYRGNMQDKTVYYNDPHWAGAGVAYTVAGI